MPSLSSSSYLQPTIAFTWRGVRTLATHAFVWGCWVLMFFGQLVLVTRYARIYPFSDEVYYMTASITPQWLWAQHAEHRIPLAKLLWLGVLRLTNYDFTVGKAISAIMLAGIAWALLQTVRNLRGHISFSDAFLPLAVLNFGAAVNVVWWWQINHLLAPTLAMALLSLILLGRDRLSVKYALLVGATLMLLPLTGPGGLPYALALGLWLLLRGVLSYRSSVEPNEKRASALLCAMAVVAVCLVGFYFVDYSVPEGTSAGVPTRISDLGATLQATLQITSMSLGPAIQPYWTVAGISVLALLLFSAATLLVVWRTRPGERFRALGLLAFIGAVGALFLILGRSRAGLGDGYIFYGHYVNLGVPALYVAYVVSVLYGRPRTRHLVQVGLLGAACVFFVGNMQRGILAGKSSIVGQADFIRDLQAGVPAFILAERHMNFLNPSLSDWRDIDLAGLLDGMHQADVPQLATLANEPVYQDLPINATPSAVVTPAPGQNVGLDGRSPAADTRLVFDIGAPRFVYAIRVQGTYDDSTPRHVVFQMIWNGVDPQHPGNVGQAKADTALVGIDPNALWDVWFDRMTKKTLTMWVNDVISGFSIVPDGPRSDFRVSSVTLLVPPSNS